MVHGWSQNRGTTVLQSLAVTVVTVPRSSVHTVSGSVPILGVKIVSHTAVPAWLYMLGCVSMDLTCVSVTSTC